jgi:hypothetical protein
MPSSSSDSLSANPMVQLWLPVVGITFAEEIYKAKVWHRASVPVMLLFLVPANALWFLHASWADFLILVLFVLGPLLGYMFRAASKALLRQISRNMARRFSLSERDGRDQPDLSSVSAFEQWCQDRSISREEVREKLQ